MDLVSLFCQENTYLMYEPELPLYTGTNSLGYPEIM